MPSIINNWRQHHHTNSAANISPGSYTVSGGDDRRLICAIHWCHLTNTNFSAVPSLTYGGQTMSRHIHEVCSYDEGWRGHGIALFTLHESGITAAGSAGFGLSWSGYTPHKHGSWVAAYSNVSSLETDGYAVTSADGWHTNTISTSLSAVSSSYIVTFHHREESDGLGHRNNAWTTSPSATISSLDGGLFGPGGYLSLDSHISGLTENVGSGNRSITSTHSGYYSNHVQISLRMGHSEPASLTETSSISDNVTTFDQFNLTTSSDQQYGGLSTTPDFWWRLNETSGSIAANTGQYGVAADYNGMLQGFSGSYWLGGSESWGSGGITGGLLFDGSNDCINVANALPLGGATKITFAVWSTSEGTTEYTRILQNGNGASSNLAQYQIGANYDGYRSRINGTTQVTTGNYWKTTKRHAVVVLDLTLSSNQMKVYFDGSMTPSLQYTLSAGSAIKPNSDYPGIQCIIGANQPNDAPSSRIYFWKGKLADIRIWLSAATSEEVKKIYENALVDDAPYILSDSASVSDSFNIRSNRDQSIYSDSAGAADSFFGVQDGDELKFVGTHFFPNKLVFAEDLNRISSNIRAVRNSEVNSIAPFNKQKGAFWLDISNTSSYQMRVTAPNDQYIGAFAINPVTHEADYSVAVGGDKFTEYSIKTNKIGSGQLLQADFEDSIFTSDKIADNSQSRFAASAIGSGTLSNNVIGRNQVSSGSLIASNFHIAQASVSGNSSFVTIQLNRHSLMPDFRASNTNMVLAGHSSTPDRDNPKIALSGQGTAYNYSVAWNYIVNS